MTYYNTRWRKIFCIECWNIQFKCYFCSGRTTHLTSMNFTVCVFKFNVHHLYIKYLFQQTLSYKIESINFNYLVYWYKFLLFTIYVFSLAFSSLLQGNYTSAKLHYQEAYKLDSSPQVLLDNMRKLQRRIFGISENTCWRTDSACILE